MYKNHYKPIIIPLLLLFAGMLSLERCDCKDEDEPLIKCDSLNTVYIPELIRSRFLFKIGSWWVYKNLANGDRDTFKLVHHQLLATNNIKVIGSSYTTNRCYEGFGTNYVSTYFKSINYVCAFHYPQDNQSNEQLWTRLSETFSLGTGQGDGGLTISLVGTDSIDKSDNFLYTFSDSITVAGNIYHNILHIDRNNAGFLNPFLDDFYTPNIGLIRFVRYDNTEWELESCFIQP